jgi:hypothetical protein
MDFFLKRNYGKDDISIDDMNYPWAGPSTTVSIFAFHIFRRMNGERVPETHLRG